MSTIIGLVSTFRLPLHKAAGSHTEVQKGRARGPDWTSTRPQPCQRRGGAVVR